MTSPTHTPGTRRTIRTEGWVITQIAQADGTWWNITIVRDTGR